MFRKVILKNNGTFIQIVTETARNNADIDTEQKTTPNTPIKNVTDLQLPLKLNTHVITKLYK